MAIELFDLVKVLFTNPKQYSDLKKSDKSRHAFMTNRFFSIKFPATAQQLNRVGMNPWALVDLWQIVASRFKGVPGWIYTKTKKVSTEKNWKPNPDIAKIWMQKNDVGEKELRDAIRLYPAEMKKLFSAIEKQMNVYER